MSDIFAAEDIISRIENHEHYGSCLSSDDYNNFRDDCSKIHRIRDCYNGFEEKESKLINSLNNEKKGNLQLENKRQTANNEKKNVENHLNKEFEGIKKETEIKLKNIKNSYENTKSKKKNEIKSLDTEIKKLSNIIEKLKKEYVQAIDFKKKEELNKIINEYRMKLIQYKNMKEIEKTTKENEYLIAKKTLETQKEIEFNDLKMKFELVQKIISMIKNKSLNN